jgi:AAA+ ATPase superfamily predicted ATPase
LKLYKTILCIIKSPYVNVLSEEVEKDEEKIIAGLNEDEAKALIIAYIKWKDMNKVADVMCQKYSYTVKFSLHSVKNSLK